MRTSALAAGIMCFATAAIADDPPVIRAGQWEAVGTREASQGSPVKFCLGFDTPVDFDNMIEPGQKDAQCKITSVEKSGAETNFVQTCATTTRSWLNRGTFTQAGPDAFAVKGHMDVASGQAAQGKDAAFTMTAHRLGSCQPASK